MHFGKAGAIFIVVGSVCTAKNPFVADEHKSCQLKDFQK